MSLPGVTLYLSTAVWSIIYDSIYSHQVAIVMVMMVALLILIYIPVYLACCGVLPFFLFTQCSQ